MPGCLALAIRGQDLPLPKAAVTLSPWTDLRCTGKSYEVNAPKCLSFSLRNVDGFQQALLEESQPRIAVDIPTLWRS